jgi:hypothetical protein
LPTNTSIFRHDNNTRDVRYMDIKTLQWQKGAKLRTEGKTIGHQQIQNGQSYFRLRNQTTGHEIVKRNR